MKIREMIKALDEINEISPEERTKVAKKVVGVILAYGHYVCGENEKAIDSYLDANIADEDEEVKGKEVGNDR